MEFPQDDGSPWLEIHEVHYEDDKPVMYTEKAIGVSGESIEELGIVLDRMKRALAKPILRVSDFQA